MATEIIIRECREADLPAVVDILEAKRALLATFEPRFWKQAPSSRETTGPYLASLLATGKHVFLVAEATHGIAGFLLASSMPVPPVYDAGPTAVIDDFDVVDSATWSEVGSLLLAEARRRLRELGFAQFIFVSAKGDLPKMDFLRAQGLSEHAAWFNDAV
jgi:L-amino acid N-acyltransferase YncA